MVEGLIFGFTVLVVGGGLILKMNMDMAKREIKHYTRQLEEIRQEDKGIREEDAKHSVKMDEIYANAKKYMEELCSIPLNDDEVQQLNKLLQRAKRDERFKEFANVDTWCIAYEAILANCRDVSKLCNEIKEKYSEEGEC